MTLMSIKISKISNLFKKVKFNWKRWYKLSFSISFWSLTIEFELFDYICSWFYQFGFDYWFGFQEFGSKIPLKSDKNRKFSKNWLTVDSIAQAYTILIARLYYLSCQQIRPIGIRTADPFLVMEFHYAKVAAALP